MLRQALILFLLTGLGAAFSLVSGLSPKPWVAPELKAGEIRLVDARVLDVIWIDARSPADYESAHIPGAHFYDQDLGPDNLSWLFPLWLENPRPIIVYCADEGCGTSQRIADFLRENLPDAEVYSLHGGWEAWLN